MRNAAISLLTTLAAGAALAEEPSTPSPARLGAWAESFYQWNFNDPSNGITNFRGFDNRHNTFALTNVVVDAQWDADVLGRVTLQFGLTPSTYYLSEPIKPGTSSTAPSSSELWKYVQQAWAGYKVPIGRGLSITGGVYLSPIGPEGMAVRDNWNWSRSNLFFGLPFYHSGIRASLPLTDRWTVVAAVLNGWNDVIDNNAQKSVLVQGLYTVPDSLALGVLYFGGVERPTGSPEGKPWRNLFDAYATWLATPRLALLAHANLGFEDNAFGTSWWAAGILAARVQLASWLFVVARGDAFFEETPTGATTIFWPVSWVSSGTLTFDVRPRDNVSIRLEYRHDAAEGDIYFAGNVTGDGLTTPFVPNASHQNTLTLGATTWF